MKTKTKHVALLLLASFILPLAGCAADRNAQPDGIRRAKVISQNKAGITIEHSNWGRPIAFRLAEEHCDSMGKASIHRSGVVQGGSDMISTWSCE